jgi:glutamate racemase
MSGWDNRPIGVFDSGVGGRPALGALMKLRPDADIVYFGDTGGVPYGTRGYDTIVKYARQDARFVCSFGVKLLLVACNTVSCVALDVLERELDIPVFGVLDDASRRACELSERGRIGVIATPATISRHAYARAVLALRPDAQVTENACTLFVPLVENGRISPEDPVVRLLAGEYLAPLAAAGVDTIILGCTHYPLLSDAITAAAPGARLVNSSAEAARAVAAAAGTRYLPKMPGTPGKYRYFVSDSTDSFRRLAPLFLGCEPGGDARLVDIEKY